MTNPPGRDRPRIYLITPDHLEPDAAAQKLEAAFSGGDIACVQLRLKGADDETVLAAARRLMPIAHAHDAAFLINDRADLAKACDADGVHLGQKDGDIATARNLLGFNKDIGVTCHNSRHLAFDAGDQGADYVAFGAFFPSDTKKIEHQAELETLEIWSEISEIPCVAIGGITATNCGDLVRAGADFLAISGYVWGHADGPAAAISALNTAIDAAFQPAS
ncbi:thiamine-phosphate synthase [Iodidimonas nitroreducens]|uniref:Thiamine-phosphate synthase n=1 Tax=Iodidimonas nitroreducens TaxID=1236968 RepID=A0A5A7N9F7_9PROT|nr:thiamine phosphate synthase [Iodidimonas nitroreducens]GAK33477.1 thiamine-phosphate synthase [alpha proteobacterium Q-1]GER04414.1 thiamine-phosphate synthase [Iodidimonas nitroreducens]